MATREPYANIEGPKTAQPIPRHPKSPLLQPFSHHLRTLIPDHMANSVGGPEKAGVGGSIPYLATMFSTSYSKSKPQVCSILFQFHNPGSSECASHLETKRNQTPAGGAGLGAALGAVAGGGAGALIGAGAGAGAGTIRAAATGKKNVGFPAETLLTFALRAPVSIEVAN